MTEPMDRLRRQIEFVMELDKLKQVMRRTYLTLTHLDSMASAMAQAQAGHTTPQMTMRYVRPSSEARAEHAKKMADVLYLPTGTDDDRPEKGQRVPE